MDRTRTALLGLALCFAAFSRAVAAPPGPLEVRVHRVVDGDTLVLANDDRVRLLWVNTPEVGEAAAEAATDFTRSFCEGRIAIVDTGRGPDGAPLPAQRDGYGRLLADIVVDGKSLGEELIREGHAHLFVIPPTPLRDPARLVAQQATARKRKAGIWSTPRFQSTLHITSFHANAPGDDRENLNGEYVRIANLTTGDAQLAGYTISNGHGMGLKLPAAMLPPGHTVMVFTGKGIDQLDPSDGPLKVYWGLDWPAWDNAGDTATVRNAGGHVEDELVYEPKGGPWGGRRRR